MFVNPTHDTAIIFKMGGIVHGPDFRGAGWTSHLNYFGRSFVAHSEAIPDSHAVVVYFEYDIGGRFHDPPPLALNNSRARLVHLDSHLQWVTTKFVLRMAEYATLSDPEFRLYFCDMVRTSFLRAQAFASRKKISADFDSGTSALEEILNKYLQEKHIEDEAEHMRIPSDEYDAGVTHYFVFAKKNQACRELKKCRLHEVDVSVEEYGKRWCLAISRPFGAPVPREVIDELLEAGAVYDGFDVSP